MSSWPESILVDSIVGTYLQDMSKIRTYLKYLDTDPYTLKIFDVADERRSL